MSQVYSITAIMVSLKFVAVILFLIQLYAHGLCDSKDDAQNAINLLYEQLQSANKLVEVRALHMWNVDVLNMSKTINDELAGGIEQFKLLVDNVTVIAKNYSNSEDCIRELDIFLNVSNYRVDAIDIENLVFGNLFTSATVDIQSGFDKYNELHQEFKQNCLETESSCEGLSRGIIAEVDRVLPLVKRIPYQLFAEIYLLNFRIALNWQTVQVILMVDYHKVIENATTCLASIIKQTPNTQTSLQELPQTPENLGDSVEELYENLLQTTGSASSSSIWGLLTYADDIIQQVLNDYINITLAKVRNVTFTANNTVFNIKNIARDLNITINCTSPDILSIMNSVLSRGLNDYSGLLSELVDSQYTESLNRITVITNETASIGLQVNTCEADGTCDYLAEKIVSKTGEIPLELQKLWDSTSALFLRTIPANWESGIKAARDLLEQVEVEIVSLKSCVQTYL